MVLVRVTDFFRDLRQFGIVSAIMIVRRDMPLIVFEIFVDIRFVLFPLLVLGAVKGKELHVDVVDAETLEHETAAIDVFICSVDLLRNFFCGRQKRIRDIFREVCDIARIVFLRDDHRHSFRVRENA